MGTFRVKFEISAFLQPEKRLEVEGVVDTGAAYPFIPASLLKSLGIEPTAERTFVLADGSQKKFSVGEAEFSYNGQSGPAIVVFAPEKTEPLFGAHALESLGLEVDPVNQRLKPATLFLL